MYHIGATGSTPLATYAVQASGRHGPSRSGPVLVLCFESLVLYLRDVQVHKSCRFRNAARNLSRARAHHHMVHRSEQVSTGYGYKQYVVDVSYRIVRDIPCFDVLTPITME
jgi:hypothetical protein